MSRSQEANIISALTKSDSFWSGLINTVTGFTVIGLFSAIILRTIKVIGYLRVARRNETQKTKNFLISSKSNKNDNKKKRLTSKTETGPNLSLPLTGKGVMDW